MPSANVAKATLPSRQPPPIDLNEALANIFGVPETFKPAFYSTNMGLVELGPVTYKGIKPQEFDISKVRGESVAVLGQFFDQLHRSRVNTFQLFPLSRKVTSDLEYLLSFASADAGSLSVSAWLSSPYRLVFDVQLNKYGRVTHESGRNEALGLLYPEGILGETRSYLPDLLLRRLLGLSELARQDRASNTALIDALVMRAFQERQIPWGQVINMFAAG